MTDKVHADTLEAIAKLAQANAQLDTYRKVLEYLVSRRDKVHCDCGGRDFHRDDCPIGKAINALR